MPRDSGDIQRTFSKLVEGELERRYALETIDDPRRPKTKSPVTIQIAWIGAAAIDPGATVRLVRALSDPGANDAAPFSGLKFLADEFDEGDALVDYGITMGPAAAGVTKSGTLTTRTDDNTGTLTMEAAHGIVTGQPLLLLWDGGSRSTTAGTVAGTSVPIDGGAGNILPAASTAVTAVLSAGITEAVMPEAYWARVDVSDEAHGWAGIPSGGALLESVTAGGLRIIWKEAGTGEKWAIVSLVGGEDRKVATDPTDEHPRELIGKLANTGVYNPTDHNLVYGQVVFDPGMNPDNLLRLFTAKGEGTETEKFRVFELTERKYTTESAATARWLNHDLLPNLAEDPETLADPLELFAGAAAGYSPWSSSFTRGMRGIAELWNDRPHSVAGTLTTRTDDDTGTLTLSTGHGVMTGNTVDVFWNDGANSRTGMTAGTVSGNSVPIDGGSGDVLPAATTAVNVVNQSAVLGEPLWKIVAMEGFAEWAVVNYNASGATWHFVAGGGYPWNHIRPTVDGGALTVTDPAALVGRTPANNEKALAWISDVDADPPTYQIHGVRNEDRRVAITSSDPLPLELLSKVQNGGAYDAETDLIAKVAEVDDAGVKKLRIAYTPGSGSGGGGGGLITVFIDHDIPAATEVGITSFDPAITTVELYERNAETGRYSRGGPVEVENHDVKTGLVVNENTYRGVATLNTFGRYVLHLEFCEPINTA